MDSAVSSGTGKRVGPCATARLATLLLCCMLFLANFDIASAQMRPSEMVLWTGAGLGLVGAFFMDQAIQAEVLENGRTLAPISGVGNRLGRPEFSLPVIGLLYGIGQISGRDRISDGALHAAEALAAVGVVNGALKAGVGRGRPHIMEGDADEFRPLSLWDYGWQSFPSGHTMVAFSLAAAITEETGNPWIGGLAYGTAAMVGWSRVYDNRHWTSDVVAGAILGTVVSRSTIRWLHRRGNSRLSSPNIFFAPRGVSVRIPVW